MRVTLIDKGEGWATARLEVETATEATILSICALEESKIDVSVAVTHPTYPDNAPPIEIVYFSGFKLPVHQILQNKK